MIIPFIDLKSQYKVNKSQIQARIDAVLEHGQYIMGPEVNELEEALKELTGSKYCITCSSGTDALLMSLMSLNIGVGDEVITTPFTFAATAEVIVLLGAKPVFVDVEPDSGNINAELIESAITSRTKAIIPVSLYGQTSDMDAINEIAAKYNNLPVIEDGAQSFGATYKGHQSCSLSTIGCTSFFPSKPLGCYGDGGAIFTDDDKLARVLQEIRVHGQSERYVHSRVGLGGRMDTLQCAILMGKIENFKWEVQQRNAIGLLYNKMFDKVGIERIQQRDSRSSVFAQYTIITPHRESLQKHLSDLGIPTAIHYPLALNEQPAYRHLCCPDCTPEAHALSKKVISLPMHPYLDDKVISIIVDAVASLQVE